MKGFGDSAHRRTRRAAGQTQTGERGYLTPRNGSSYHGSQMDPVVSGCYEASLEQPASAQCRCVSNLTQGGLPQTAYLYSVPIHRALVFNFRLPSPFPTFPYMTSVSWLLDLPPCDSLAHLYRWCSCDSQGLHLAASVQMCSSRCEPTESRTWQTPALRQRSPRFSPTRATPRSGYRACAVADSRLSRMHRARTCIALRTPLGWCCDARVHPGRPRVVP